MNKNFKIGLLSLNIILVDMEALLLAKRIENNDPYRLWNQPKIKK